MNSGKLQLQGLGKKLSWFKVMYNSPAGTEEKQKFIQSN
jgi:hypothetical protein